MKQGVMKMKYTMLKSVFVAMGMALLVISCGGKDEVKPEIDPNATRHVLIEATLGLDVEAGIRVELDGSFRGSQNCIQWIEYRLDGQKLTERIEIFSAGCPGRNGASDPIQRVAQLKIKGQSTGWEIYEKDDSKPIGHLNNTDFLVLDSLCKYTTDDRANRYNHCDIQAGGGIFKAIVIR